MKIPTNDEFVARARKDMCSFKTSEDYNDVNAACSTAGTAYVTGACAYSLPGNQGEVESVGMAEDRGGFSGIIFVTHEIGHL